MKKTIIICILGLAAAIMAQGRRENVIIKTGIGECPVAIDGSTVDVRMLLENIERRLNILELKTAEDPEYRKLFQPLIAEIRSLISLFPEQVYIVPVEAEIIHPMDEFDFNNLMDELSERETADAKFEFLRKHGVEGRYKIEQLAEILKPFDGVENKLEAARILKDNIVDPENAYLLQDSFTDETDSDRCIRIILPWE